MRHSLKPTINGFTLIEVLIAMVIISIAFTAILKTSSQNIRETQYLQNKTIANWVGLSILTEAKLHLITLPLQPDTLDNTTQMLNQNWKWRASLKKTNTPKVLEIDVDVLQPNTTTVLLHLVGYTDEN